MRGLNFFDFRPGVVRRVALDENVFHVGRHDRDPLDGGGDISGLVSRRNDDRNRWFARQFFRPSRNHDIRQAEDRHERRQPTVHKTGNKRHRRGHQDAALGLDDFPACELGNVAHVGAGKPVQVRLRRTEPQSGKQGEHRTPKRIVGGEHKPCPGSAESLGGFEQSLRIAAMVQGIGYQQDIASGLHAQIAGISAKKRCLRAVFRSLRDLPRRSIDPGPRAAFEEIQKLPVPAADFQQVRALGNHQIQIMGKRTAVAQCPRLALIRSAFVKIDAATGFVHGKKY